MIVGIIWQKPVLTHASLVLETLLACAGEFGEVGSMVVMRTGAQVDLCCSCIDVVARQDVSMT